MKKLTIEDLKNDMNYRIPGDVGYPISELTEVLKVTKPTIINYIKAGKIKGYKYRERWYVSENSLRKYLGLWYREE
jgi:excisionase family DNA binding protein